MRGAVTVVMAAAAVASACRSGVDVPDGAERVEVVDEVGEGEGLLTLLAFAGYVEDGSSDPEFDWVGPFERQTGCEVEVRYVDSGVEVLRLLPRPDGGYDGATVPGDAAGQLVAAGAVRAIDPGMFPAWPQVLEPLRGTNAHHYIVDGHAYGVPALYGPNLLLYDTERVAPAPESWDVLFEPRADVGRVAMLDSPMSIADAALYLRTARPELGIDDPYALTPEQLDSATALLDAQEDGVALYWTLFPDLVDAFKDGVVTAGSASVPLSATMST
jgi:putative spermidine/putrescine transport system substrate-binding protein